MRDCPECKIPVDGPACPQCGLTDARTHRSQIDPLRYLCHHENRGQRCANLGTFSPNTYGDPKGGAHPGPWFCWQHAMHVHGGTPSGHHTVDAERLAATRKALGLQRLDAEAIAERLAIQSGA